MSVRSGSAQSARKRVNRLGRVIGLVAFQGIEVQEGEELEDFLVEIEILTECRHPNIVGLYDVYFFEQKLWVIIHFHSLF